MDVEMKRYRFFKRSYTFVTCTVTILAALLFITLQPSQAEKVTICHKPGTPAENTLVINSNALQAHLDHGDYSGACESGKESVSVDIGGGGGGGEGEGGSGDGDGGSTNDKTRNLLPGPNTPRYSATFSFEDVESINLNNVVGTVIDGVVVSIDPTGQSVKGPILDFMCTGLHEVMRKRLAHFKPELIKLASTRIEPGMLTTPDQPQGWGEMFHFYRKRDKDGRLFAYDHEYNGFASGFERTYKRLRAGAMGGFLRANVETDSESFRIDSNTYFTGVYGQYDFGRIKLAASLISGYEDHENSRMVFDNLSGDETARADFGSMFLSQSVTVRADYTVAHRLLLRPSATVTYSAGWYDEYHDHGTTRSNLEIDDRTLQALNGKLQLSAYYQIADWCDFELSVGGTARYTDDGSIDANLGGSDFRFTATNDDSVYAGQLGAYLSVDVNYRLELYANGEFSDASGGETRDFFMVGLKFDF